MKLLARLVQLLSRYSIADIWDEGPVELVEGPFEAPSKEERRRIGWNGSVQRDFQARIRDTRAVLRGGPQLRPKWQVYTGRQNPLVGTAAPPSMGQRGGSFEFPAISRRSWKRSAT